LMRLQDKIRSQTRAISNPSKAKREGLAKVSRN